MSGSIETMIVYFSALRGVAASPVRSLVVALCLIGAATLAAAQPGAPSSSLLRARALYNEKRYDAAVAAATLARKDPANADSAAVVLARAHLEMFRRGQMPSDLAAAREALATVHPSALKPRERVEYLIGLGEALFLDDAYGAAAEIFESALGRAIEVGASAQERVLDWWASALERHATPRSVDERSAVYRRILDRMTTTLEQDPTSGAAVYWIAAASRGMGDLDRAWQAAIAGWIRAPLTVDRGVMLRADLDQLVTQAIIPDRVRRVPVAGREEAGAALRSEWEMVKEKWK